MNMAYDTLSYLIQLGDVVTYIPYLFMCVYACACIYVQVLLCRRACVEVRQQLWVVSSFLSLRGSQRLNSGQQIWQQVFLSAVLFRFLLLQ